jgi:thiamine-phosphate pyrophosphorylase
MHQMSPGVERAVAGARGWADRLGSEPLRLGHLVLGLLDEEEGRPAVLLDRVGAAAALVRERLTVNPGPAAPPLSALYDAAHAWSVAHRDNPEFLTDAFLLAVLSADHEFGAACAELGFAVEVLERALGVRAGNDLTPPSRASGDGLRATSSESRDAPESPISNSPLSFGDGNRGVGSSSTAGIGGARGSPEASEFVLPDTSGETAAARILDANFNRAREAARVLEDYCRFALDDRFLTEQVKTLRHGLAAAGRKLPPRALLAARDTIGDVGTTVTTAGEYDRHSPAHVALVNAKRLQESLRSLEEFGKVFGPDLGRDLEALRYRAYTVERAIARTAAGRDRLAAARLYVLVTRGQCPAAVDWTIREAARGGADVVQLREKTLPDRELIECARNVRRWTREVGVLFVVNDRPDVARLCDADGVHLGQDDMSPQDARRVAGPDVLVGISTHTVDQLRAAVLAGADYVGIGPTFPSKTKAFDHFPGLEFVRAASAETALPAFALGGIGLANVAQVVAAGATRIAVGAAVCAADDPEQAARLLKAVLVQ